MQHCFTRALWGWLLATFVLLGSTLLPSAAEATGIYQMPQLSAGSSTWVVDDADVLSRLNFGKISDRLEALAASTGTEVRLVTLHRLDYGETPDSFASALFEKWFPTPEAQANQVLVVLDDVTNGAAVQVGDEAATQLTEEISQSIAAETIAVPLRQGGQYNRAFLNASDRLVAVLSGEADPGPPVVDESFEIVSTFSSAEETEENRSNSTVIVVGFLIAATVIPMLTYYAYMSMGG
ncbi:MAG: photosystem II repair protein Psb32 [Leptolyngbyaceae cyanobacterium]